MTVITAEPEMLNSYTPIQKFYAGQNVLITGGTGFFGKIMIEKLLRSCPDVSSIYLIVRAKKGQDAHQRLESLFDNPVFDRLKKEVPKFRHKIITIAGDCSLPGLGMTVADRELIQREVSIVFNAAATVRFNEGIKQAVNINVSGTKEILDLCRSLQKLKVVIHVSTAYSNCNHWDIDEKFYEAPLTGDNAIKLVQSLDEKKLDAITPTLLGDFPNTYTFTKCIAEQVVQQHGKDLPTGIFRPAIVISSCQEPVSGWIDNLYGPTGALVGGGAGLIRALNMDKDCTAEIVPVDYAVNALIATAWDVANNKNEDAEPPIYTFHSSWSTAITWGQYINLAFNHGKKVPSIRSIWCYSITTTKNYYVYSMLLLFLHLIPAFFIDLGLFITRKEPRMLKIYKKIHKFLAVTSYFSLNKWTFRNDNTMRLWEKLNTQDQETFYFSMRNFNWDDFMAKCLRGLRIYIFKDDPDNVPDARKRMSRFVMLHRFIKYAFIGLLIWAFYATFSFFLSFGGNMGVTTVSQTISIR